MAKPELAVAPGLKSAALTVLEEIVAKLIDCERRIVIGLPAPTTFESNGKFDTAPVPFISSQPTSKIAERVWTCASRLPKIAAYFVVFKEASWTIDGGGKMPFTLEPKVNVVLVNPAVLTSPKPEVALYIFPSAK